MKNNGGMKILPKKPKPNAFVSQSQLVFLSRLIYLEQNLDKNKLYIRLFQ